MEKWFKAMQFNKSKGQMWTLKGLGKKWKL